MGKRYHYTYRVKFPSQRWFYFGLHSTNNLNDGYTGSPHTHKNKWKNFHWEIEILEFHDSREIATEVEKRLILPFLNDSACLNECAACWNLSKEVHSKAGRRGAKTLHERHAHRISEWQQKATAAAREKKAYLTASAKALEANRKAVVLTSVKDGTELCFDGVRIAARALNLKHQHLCRVLKGIRKSTGGYTVRYQ